MRIKAALLGIAIVCVAACVTEGGDEAGTDWDGDGKADGASSAVPLIQRNSAFYWADSDYASFTASYNALAGYTMQAPLSDEDRLTARVQGWVDRLDAIVRSEVERSTGSPLVAPKPRVKILPSGSTFNAWVSPVVACSGVAAAGADIASPTHTFLGSETSIQGDAVACVHPSYPDIAEFRTLWGLHKPTCTLTEDLQITGCTVDNYGAAGELSFLATSPYIHVSSDLIAASSEASLVVTLAHELGHYYRSHSSEADLQHYDFWYETEKDRKKVPVSSTLAAQLQTAYAEIVNGPQTVQAATPGVYSPRLRAWILESIAPLLRERTEPGFVCASARDLLGPWTEELLAGYGLPSDTMNQYLAFEDALAACAPKLDMGSGGTATSLSYGTVLMSVSSAKLKNVSFPFYATLQNILDNLDVKAKALDDKEARLLQKVRDNRIGLYTVEQEADNIALSLSTKLGMSGDDVLKYWLEFMVAIAHIVPESYRAQYEADAAYCSAQLESGFITEDASGTRTPTFVPIGDLSEPHHSECYRLFNLWREQKIRKYEPATSLTFEPGWDELRAYAQQVSDTARTNGL